MAGVSMLEVMKVINTASVFVMFILVSLAFLYYWRRLRRSIPFSDDKFWYLAVYAATAWASAWASGLSLLFGRFWMYPLSIGLCIAVVTYFTYVRRVTDFKDEQ
jgi:hypothetical protein